MADGRKHQRTQAAEAEAAKPPKPRKSLWESTRETLDSILVALVLASIFRTFVMEAFEIPTGSMAPTLYGRHVDVTCPACGYLYSVGEDRQLDPRQPARPTVCPLCGSLNDLASAARGGDRILVDKGVYTLGNPKRWDVGVFVNPHEHAENYIKRIVGLPGDELQIKRGDLYINNHIARKPDAVQEVLWMPVFDANYIPNQSWTDPFPDVRDLQHKTQHVYKTPEGGYAWAPPWRAEAAADAPRWDLSGQVFTYAPAAAEPSMLRFNWKVLDAYGYTQGIRDTESAVGDVRVRSRVTLAGPGVVYATIIDDEYRIDYILSGDPARPGSRVTINGKDPPLLSRDGPPLLERGREHRIAFVNVDHRAWLEVDGRQVLGAVDFDSLTLPPRGETEPSKAVLLGVAGAAAKLADLKVDRDIYYTETSDPDRAYGVAGKITLKENEYFVCGDNSPSSSDSRRWWRYSDPEAKDVRQAVVPRDHFIGKALVLFWPGKEKLGRVKIVH